MLAARWTPKLRLLIADSDLSRHHGDMTDTELRVTRVIPPDSDAIRLRDAVYRLLLSRPLTVWESDLIFSPNNPMRFGHREDHMVEFRPDAQFGLKDALRYIKLDLPELANEWHAKVEGEVRSARAEAQELATQWGIEVV